MGWWNLLCIVMIINYDMIINRSFSSYRFMVKVKNCLVKRTVAAVLIDWCVINCLFNSGEWCIGSQEPSSCCLFNGNTKWLPLPWKPMSGHVLALPDLGFWRGATTGLTILYIGKNILFWNQWTNSNINYQQFLP